MNINIDGKIWIVIPMSPPSMYYVEGPIRSDYFFYIKKQDISSWEQHPYKDKGCGIDNFGEYFYAPFEVMKACSAMEKYKAFL